MSAIRKAGLAVATGLAILVLSGSGLRAEEPIPDMSAAEPSTTALPTDQILAHPELADPFSYATAVQALWAKGARLQATFWFYVFQERTRPWALADQNGDGASALRASINDGLGPQVNGWIASDVGAWKAVVERAMAYESHFPLYGERPSNMTAKLWSALVDRTRAEYVAGARKAFDSMSAEDVASSRKQAGLYVGPLQDPGPALPDGWR
ncbi:hypothetical protein SAMN05216548_11145 [Faunimonas pinastri]|uniref:Uncharacterized protein n=1 Tax=Faunimonas pinastri TaxID=1855383 RepID=A0A1H9LC94_9HYPH|nr:hypothetical protein [Faunimonas pinastri]SER08990.1 hypothetical protein SAMN05216548_11145 [Faunimonas pinastri]